MAEGSNAYGEEGQSSESVNNICNSSNAPPPESESSDTSLKLGWVKFAHSFLKKYLIICFSFTSKTHRASSWNCLLSFKCCIFLQLTICWLIISRPQVFASSTKDEFIWSFILVSINCSNGIWIQPRLYSVLTVN